MEEYVLDVTRKRIQGGCRAEISLEVSKPSTYCISKYVLGLIIDILYGKRICNVILTRKIKAIKHKTWQELELELELKYRSQLYPYLKVYVTLWTFA